MTNAQILAKVILDIENALGDYIGKPQNARHIIDAILLIMDETKAVEIAERIQKGFIGPRLVK